MLKPRHCVLAGAVLVLACGARGVGAQTPAAAALPPAAALLRQLDQVSIDPAQVYDLRDARLARGGVSFYFDRGFIGFFRPVKGEVTGAVFAGDAEVLLIPPDPVEKLSLARFTGSAILEERCSFVYLRFTGHEARELLAQSHRPDPQDPEQPGNFAGRWNPTVARFNPLYSVRVLEDLLGGRDKPLFAAQVQGRNLGMFIVSDDERLPENVSVTALKHVKGVTYSDLWCSYASRARRSREANLGYGSARALSYDIHTRILKDNSLHGRTKVDLESLSSRDRVVVLKLSSRLHVESVKDAQGKALTVLWPGRGDENGTQPRQSDWVAVVLPAAEPAGTKYRLTFTYSGNVITDEGNGVLYVGARESWYPNFGPNVRAPYVLNFEYPDTLTLVATGECVAEGSAAEGWKHSRWISDGPFPVAGFNLGAYEQRTRLVGKVEVKVYATRDAEASLVRQLTPRLSPIPLELQRRAAGGLRSGGFTNPPVVLDPAALLDRVVARAAHAISYFQTLFGPFPYPHLALSQVPGNFGQGWPELIYLPTLSFFVGDQGLTMPGTQSLQGLQEELFVSHEIAHQWWGNEVGWKTYHDQWLSEGFASYAAALELERSKDGERKFHELFRQYKRDLLSKTADGKTVESGGPIWLGRRLNSSLDPRGYDEIVYKKACWVLHMLRCLMDGASARGPADSKERFFKMLRDFENTYRGQSPSTEDFIKIADRYMTPEMDLDHNHSLEWFFTDWVFGTGIPVYKIHSTTRRLRSGRYLTTGTIEQSGVPEGFEMLVPLVARAGKNREVPLGRVAVGPTGSFRFRTSFKPEHITVDENQILAEVH